MAEAPALLLLPASYSDVVRLVFVFFLMQILQVLHTALVKQYFQRITLAWV